MAEYDAGQLFAQIVPSFRGVRQQIEAEAKQWAQTIQRTLEPALPDALRAAARTASEQGSRAGADYGGSFARMVRDRIDAALKALPKAKPGVDATELDAELEDIRAKLAALRDVRVGVDLRAEDALAEVDRLQGRLEELARRSPDIQVRADTAAATAQLEAIQAEVNHLDGDTARIDVDTSSASSGISGLTLAALGLGPALVPIGAAATAGLAGVATVAASSAAGIGVLALAFSGIIGALQQLQQAHQQTAVSAASSGRQQESAARQVQSAEAALAQARQNADSAAIRSAEAVRNARQSLADAERTAAEQIAAAARQVSDAEYNAAQADVAAASAQERLNQAREQAARDLEDAANRQEDAELGLRQAQLDAADALTHYNQVMADATATDEDRARAQLDLDQANQRVVEAQQEVTRATEDNTKAQADGVNGAQAVIDATKAVADAKHNQVQAHRDVSDAQRHEQDVTLTAAENITKAQQSLGDAIRAQHDQTRQSAYAVASAQRAVASALDAQAAAAAPANAALARANQTLAALSPAGREFVTFVQRILEPAFKTLRAVAQQNLLPGLESGIKAAMPLMPAFTRFVGGLAKTMGDLFAQAGRALTSPFWTRFFGYVDATAGPTLVVFAHVLGNLAKGFAGLMEAFAPVVIQMGSGIEHLTKRFADFGAHAGGNAGFQHFIGYIQTTGPLVVSTLGKIIAALAHVVEAVAPIGTIALHVIGAFADILRSMPITVLQTLVAVAIPLAAALKAWSIWQGIVNSELVATIAAAWGLEAVPVVALIVGIIAAVAALVFGIIELVKHWDAVWSAITAATSAAWAAITSAFSTAWDWVSGFVSAHWPLLLGLVAGPLALAAAEIAKHWGAVEAAFSAAWSWLSGTWSTLWAGAKDIVLAPIHVARDAIEAVFGSDGRVQAAFSGLWTWLSGAWSTMWGGVADVIMAPIHIARNAIETLFGSGGRVQGAFQTAVSGIETIWGGLKAIAKAPIKFIVDIVLNKGLIAAWNWIADKLPGVPSIDPIKLPGFAAGGVIPGYAPGVDSVLALVSPGESILRPEVTRWLGADAINQMNTAAMRGQLPRFATGVANFDPNPIHIIQSAGGAIGDAAGAAWGGVKTVAEAIADPLKWIVEAIKKPLAELSSITGSPWGRLVAAVPRAIATKLLDWAKSLVGFLGNHGLSPDSAQSLARAMLPHKGWEDQTQWPALLTLWDNESGWKWDATNPDSGAYGIPQALPGSKMASAGPDWKTNAATQIIWGLGYIADRYGTPAAALDFWNAQTPHWYDAGGYLPPGVSVAINGTGRPEPVFTSAQWASLRTADAGGISRFEGDLYLDSGEFLGKVRGEAERVVDNEHAALLQEIRAQ
jgi:hypothetical protein